MRPGKPCHTLVAAPWGMVAYIFLKIRRSLSQKAIKSWSFFEAMRYYIALLDGLEPYQMITCASDYPFNLLEASPVTSFVTNLLGFDIRFSTTSMYAQIPHLNYLLKHHPLPLFKGTFIDFLTSVFDFMTQSGMLIRKQMMLLDIRPQPITESYEVLVSG